ncbi:phage minor capsid protein [Nocardia africana]
MPLTPSFGDKLIGPIQRLYGEAELRVFRWLVSLVFGDSVAAGLLWLTRMLLKLPRLRAGLVKITRDLDAESQKRVETALRAAWATGRSAAHTDSPSVLVPDAAALEKLIDDVNRAVSDVNRNIPRVGENIYRQTVQEAVREQTDRDRRKAMQRALDKFARRGITGFVDQRGRRYDLVSYVETAVRTAITHAEVEAYTQQLAAAGHDLVIVSDVAGSCPMCLPFEGHVISISGATVGAISRDTRTGRAVKVDVLCSLAEARERGLFHRGCRHTISVWTPDDPLPPAAVRTTEAARVARRQQLYDIRKARMNDRLAAVAGDAPRRRVVASAGNNSEKPPATVHHLNPPPVPPTPGGRGGGGDGGGDDFDRIPIANIHNDLSKLTEAERDALESYGLIGESLNQKLRENQPLSTAFADMASNLRSALRKYAVPETVRVTREVDAGVYGITDNASAQNAVGRIFHEAGFLSTAMAANPPRNTRRPNAAILDLAVPRGTHAVALGELAEFPAERELLVIDARSIRIVGVSFDQDKNRWRLRGYVVD